jgi:hypothetical protein
MQSNISGHCSNGALPVHLPELGSWAAREEARKFWENYIYDECVYLAHPFDVDAEVPHIFAEKYFLNELWFHIRWAQLDTGKTGNHNNEALIEFVPVDESCNALRKLDSPIAAVDRDSAMFVEVPEFVELPERFRLQGIRSVVRLKRIQSGMDTDVEESAFFPVGVIGSTDREDNLVRGLVGGDSFGEKMDQVPSKLVERCAKTVNKVPHGKGDFLGSSACTDYEKVLSSIRIILFGHGVRVAIDPVSHLFFSRLEVKVSPSGFHVDILN